MNEELLNEIMSDPVLKRLYENGKKLRETLNITEEDIREAIREIRKQEDW